MFRPSMAPPKNLVTAVCVILAAPISYAVYLRSSLLVAAVVLIGLGIIIPRLYGYIAVSESEISGR